MKNRPYLVVLLLLLAVVAFVAIFDVKSIVPHVPDDFIPDRVVRFVIEYECDRRSKTFKSKESADQFKASLSAYEFDVKVKAVEPEADFHPGNPNDLSGPFRPRPSTEYVVEYWTDGSRTIEFSERGEARRSTRELSGFGCRVTMTVE